MTSAIAAHDRLAVALDVPTIGEAGDLARMLTGHVGWFKIGLELFAAYGPEAVARIRPHGRVFLDLKLHDIPTTVERAATRLADLDVDLVTVHALGGSAMIRAAVAGLGDADKVLAVTILTSLGHDDLDAIGMDGTDVAVPRLASMAVVAGAGGLVCSPSQAAAVRVAVGQASMIVTPGIRMADGSDDDHAQASAPAAAIDAGADLLVVGRPITRAPDPVAAAKAFSAAIAR